VTHGNTVRNRDCSELKGVAATGVDTFLGCLGQTVQAEVAGGDFVPRTGDTNLGLIPVFVSHADGTEHSARGGFLDTVCDVATTGFHVVFWHKDKSTPFKLSVNSQRAEGKHPRFVQEAELGWNK
jgi:GMP synthase-like glutamine amidotransferase